MISRGQLADQRKTDIGDVIRKVGSAVNLMIDQVLLIYSEAQIFHLLQKKCVSQIVTKILTLNLQFLNQRSYHSQTSSQNVIQILQKDTENRAIHSDPKFNKLLIKEPTFQTPKSKNSIDISKSFNSQIDIHICQVSNQPTKQIRKARKPIQREYPIRKKSKYQFTQKCAKQFLQQNDPDLSSSDLNFMALEIEKNAAEAYENLEILPFDGFGS